MPDQDFQTSTAKRYSKKSELMYSPKKDAQGYLGNQHKKENEYVLLSFLPIAVCSYSSMQKFKLK